MAKEKVIKKIIIRACVGCILPVEYTPIGHGEYLIQPGDKNQYYDYEINQSDYDEFILENQRVLIDNNLLKIEKTEEELEKQNKEAQPFISPNGYKRKVYN